MNMTNPGNYCQVAVLNRQGVQTRTAGPPGPLSNVLVSPVDDSRVLAGVNWLVTVGESARTALRDAEWEFWGPDGRRLVTISDCARASTLV